MTPSVYVVQKSSGKLFCVTKDHYEKYPHWYDFIGESMIAKEEVRVEKLVDDPITPIDIQPTVDIEMTIVDKKVQTRTRKTKR